MPYFTYIKIIYIYIYLADKIHNICTRIDIVSLGICIYIGYIYNYIKISKLGMHSQDSNLWLLGIITYR